MSGNAPTAFGATGGSQVDLNTIPTSLVERVEVVSIGGAPIYGSDAIAGVVNVQMKRDFEGFEWILALVQPPMVVMPGSTA